MKKVRFLLLLGSFVVFGGAIAACGPPPLPDPPTNIQTDTNLNIDGKIEFTFELTEDLKDRVEKIRVYRDSAADGKFTDLVKEYTLDEDKLDKEKRVYKFSLLDSNVMPGDKYDLPFFYRFVSVGKASVYSNVASEKEREGKPSEAKQAKTTNALKPKEVEGTTITSQNYGEGPQIQINWTSNKEYDIKGYYIFRSTEDKPIAAADVSQAINRQILGPDKRSYLDTDVKEGERYYYLVVAIDKGDFIGDYQPKTRFPGLVLGKATLIAPEDSSKVAKPTFKWSGVNGAQGYVVVLKADIQADKSVWRSDFVTGTEVQYPSSAESLTQGKKYYWFVYAYPTSPSDPSKDDGNSRSETWSFTAE